MGFDYERVLLLSEYAGHPVVEQIGETGEHVGRVDDDGAFKCRVFGTLQNREDETEIFFTELARNQHASGS